MAWATDFRRGERRRVSGTFRQRTRRKQVAGPYMSESSVPSIRARATPRERRSVPYSPPSPATNRDTQRALGTAPSTFTGKSGADLPALLGMSKAQRDTLIAQGIEASGLRQGLRAVGNEGASTLEALEIASLGIPGVGVAGLGGKAALRGGLSLAEKLRASSEAVKASEKVIRAATRAKPVRNAARRAAAKAEPAAVRAGRQRAGAAAGRAAEKVPKPVRAAGRAAGTVATLPVKRPFTAPIAAQAPAAALSGDPGEFGKAFTGDGTLAAIGGALGDTAASAVPGRVAQNAIKDAFNLPAVILPSAYLPARAGVKAIGGDSSEAEALWSSYMEEGAIPAALRGDGGAALNAIVDHPLYSALEVSGGAALAGRAAGAATRSATRGRVGGTERPPVHIRGQEHLGNVNEIMGRGRYSPDLIRQGIQRLYDNRRGETIEPRAGLKGFLGLDPATRAMKHSARRFAHGEEQVRRVNRAERIDSMKAHMPRQEGRLGRADKASADVVAQAVQRVAQRSETLLTDLSAYRGRLDQELHSGSLTKVQQKANRAMAAQIDRAIESGDPVAISRSAEAFRAKQEPIVAGLAERGLLDPDQAARSALFPWARLHMGADHKPGAGLVDRDGNPLPTERIAAEMRERGVDPPGFLSQRPNAPGAGAFWQSFFPNRQSLPSQGRTGKATLQGTYDASYKALTEQLVYSGSKLDAVKSFDKLIQRFGIPAPATVRSMADAWDATRDPERFGATGFPSGTKLRPMRAAPFLAARAEITKAQEHQRRDGDSPLLDPEQAAASEALDAKLLKAATEEGPGPYVYVPDVIYRELEGIFQRSGTLEKAGTSLGQFAKSAWLPFSPPFYIGNFVDNYLRMALAGIGPSDIRLGYQAVHGRNGIPGLLERDVAGSESIMQGAGYSSVIRQRIHRDSKSYEGTSLYGLARALEGLGQTPGPEHVWKGFTASRDLLLGLNARLTERLPSYGALGKEVRRELQAKTGQWHHALTISDGAFKDLLDGLGGTDKQIQHARAVEQVFGNWKAMGRAGKVLSSFSPFWQWARASTRLVFFTLPAHHPIKTGILAAAAEMTEEERARLGLDKYASADPLPAFLQGTLPIGDGVARNIPKYTSFGVFNDWPDFLSRMFLPQAQSPLAALQGLDWKGDKLTKADGTPADAPERTALALLTASSQFIPGLALLESATGVSLPGSTGGQTGPGKFSPFATYEGGKLDYFRSLSKSRQIDVPIKGSGSGSGAGGIDYNSAFGTSGSGIDYGSAFGGN